MKKRSKKTKRSTKKKTRAASKKRSLSVYAEANRNKKQIELHVKKINALSDRLEDSEIHINLLTRLVTTLCVEKLGMRVGVLKRLLKRIEKEAIRDSQILHLESLYNLPHASARKSSNKNRAAKKDPWDEIS